MPSRGINRLKKYIIFEMAAVLAQVVETVHLAWAASLPVGIHHRLLHEL